MKTRGHRMRRKARRHLNRVRTALAAGPRRCHAAGQPALRCMRTPPKRSMISDGPGQRPLRRRHTGIRRVATDLSAGRLARPARAPVRSRAPVQIAWVQQDMRAPLAPLVDGTVFSLTAMM